MCNQLSGLEQARNFYAQVGEIALQRAFPDLFCRMAVGLVGEGSECLGFDDALSCDHDWAIGFCIWLTREDYQQYGTQVQQLYQALCPDTTGQLLSRRGCFCTQDWYAKYLGCKGVPATPQQWLRIPSSFLATATNGAVFYDGLGEFTNMRNQLGYPADVWRKKIAYQLAQMAQTGQYNYPRCLQRQDLVGEQLALAMFSTATMEVVYLLNQRYAPFYKWMHRGLQNLPKLPRVAEKLTRIAISPQHAQQEIEQICILVRGELQRQDLSYATDSFLIAHSQAVLDRIEDPVLRNSHCMEE